MQKILVVDDDNDLCLLLCRFLTRNGYLVEGVGSGTVAIELLGKYEPDLILSDFRLGDMTGIELFVRIKEILPQIPVIFITGYSDVKEAVEIMKMGAYDYVTKPLFPDEILLTIKKALADELIESFSTTTSSTRHTGIQTKNKAKIERHYITGNSIEFANIIKQIELVAPTNFSVIIYGESGSGKEEIARQIHQKSKRKDKPFVPIDCGALSKDLAGSELFGHEKGAFTGALSQKTGSLEIANGGTVFLDEIGNLSYDIQISLLRVVQERKIRRVGGIKDIDIDVRIIIASNEKLWEAARAGKFREDLYHRFNEFSIEVPALRERKKDIMIFAQHFLNLTNLELGKNVLGFTCEVDEALNNYVWYGNLRELKNVIKRATLLTDGDYIELKSLPFEIINFFKLQFESPVKNGVDYNLGNLKDNNIANIPPGNRLKTANMDAEYEVILDALKQSDFNKSRAARLLDIDRKTLYNKMRQFKEFNIE